MCERGSFHNALCFYESVENMYKYEQIVNSTKMSSKMLVFRIFRK